MISVLFVRKTVVIGYDTNVVQGAEATVFASKPDDAFVIEKKQIKNKGEASLAFPADYAGESYIEVHGSREGVDAATIVV